MNDNLDKGSGKFANKFTNNDVLAAVSKTMLRTTAHIAKNLGCSIPTARRYLEALKKENKIMIVEINDGTTICWRKL